MRAKIMQNQKHPYEIDGSDYVIIRISFFFLSWSHSSIKSSSNKCNAREFDRSHTLITTWQATLIREYSLLAVLHAGDVTLFPIRRMSACSSGG